MTAGTNLIIHGQNGDNITLTGHSGNDQLYAGNGTQTLNGNAGNDLLVGGIGNQLLYGGSGDDYIFAGWGNQTLDGGSGKNVLDFSRIAGRLVVDQDLHTATIYDPATGTLLYSYSVTGFSSVIGTGFGSTIWGQHNTSNTYNFGAGTNIYNSESGGDTITTAANAVDTFHWEKKYVADAGKVDTITNFHLATDKLDMSDFLKGQYVNGVYLKNPSYAQVVKIVDHVEANGSHDAMIQTLVGGSWHDTVILAGIDINNVGADHHTLKLADVGLI